MNILLIAGGWSSERDVSLSGAKIIQETLESAGHTLVFFDPAKRLSDLPAAAQAHDFAFINLHGSPGEDGLIQAMLDQLKLPYQGSGPAASMLALNKAVSKSFFRGVGLNTADWHLLTSRPAPAWQPAFPYPVFIKANTGGSSLNMERVESEDALGPALDRLFSVCDAYLVEPQIKGAEITCGVLGNLKAGNEFPEALPPILIKPKASATGIFDYTSKYALGGAEEICPAPISEALTQKIQAMALKAHTVLGLSGYSRSDFIVPEDDDPVILEVNTLPGMTKTSLLPQEAACVGLSYGALLDRLILLGMARVKGTDRP